MTLHRLKQMDALVQMLTEYANAMRGALSAIPSGKSQI